MLLARIGAGNIVEQVIVGPDGPEAEAIGWCVETLGGWWVPTWQDHPTERYAGIGMVYVPGDARRFLYEGEE